MAQKDLGMVTSYAYALSQGYTGTEEEFAEGVLASAEYADNAQASATAAAQSKTDAEAAASSVQASAQQIATNTADIADIKSDLSNVQYSIANNFSTTALYTKGEYCYYDGSLYVCTVDRHRGAWDGTHFQYTKVGAELWYTNKQLTEEIEALAEDVAENYAKQDGYYDEMAVGSAEQLISTVTVEDKVPYLFRTSGGSADIGDRETDKIVGGTVAWNQRCPTQYKTVTNSTTDTRSYIQLVFRKASSPYTSILSGTINATGMFASVGKSTFDGQAGVIHNGSANNLTLMGSMSVYTNHVYLYSVKVNGYDPREVDGISLDNQQVFDLTQMFGTTIADYIYSLETATAGAGVAFFRKLFPKPYYAYDAGTLKHVEGLTSHDMTGFNQWDEEWEVGSYNINTGDIAGATDRIRCKNYIPCVPSTSYYFTAKTVASALWANVLFYDADKNYISYTGVYSPSSSSSAGFNNPFTTPSNAYYMRFYLNSTYGTTYNHDICINLHWDGSEDGRYEAYVKHSYPLDDSLTLRGVPKLDSNNQLYYDGDIYANDGTVTRKYGIVDLGSLTWNYHTDSGNMYADNAITNRLVNGGSICARYMWAPGNSYGGEAQDVSGLTTDKSYTFQSTLTHRIIARDTSYTSASAFKTAMNGVYLLYELATPTEETAEPYTNPQIVDDFGTEEYVTDSIVPIGHETYYMNNLRAKVEMSPDSPDGDGDYIVRQANGENTYVPLVIPSELPTAPSENGTYTLKVTVSNGTATYSWVSG